MKSIPVAEIASRVNAQLPQGAFLCVNGQTPNVMTIGWGGLAYYWRRDVFVAPVRQQRHTYPLLMEGREFTVCVPKMGTMKQEIAQAGTLSGRDGDKFAAMGLAPMAAQEVSAPIIAGCDVYLECVVRAHNAFDGASTDEDIIKSAYPAGDFHTLFYGEIVACYVGEDE